MAVDGTPVIDLKAHFPVSDWVKDVHTPAWLTGWSEWVPGEGLGLKFISFSADDENQR
jgi:hypothetical protein